MSVYQFLKGVDPESIEEQFDQGSEEETFVEFSLIPFSFSIYLSLAIGFLLVIIAKIYFFGKKTVENSNSIFFTVNFQNYFDRPVINEITIHHASVPNHD